MRKMLHKKFIVLKRIRTNYNISNFNDSRKKVSNDEQTKYYITSEQRR